MNLKSLQRDCQIVGFKESNKGKSSCLTIKEIYISKKLRVNKDSNLDQKRRKEMNKENKKTLKQLKKEHKREKQLIPTSAIKPLERLSSYKPQKPIAIFDSECNRLISR